MTEWQQLGIDAVVDLLPELGAVNYQKFACLWWDAASAGEGLGETGEWKYEKCQTQMGLCVRRAIDARVVENVNGGFGYGMDIRWCGPKGTKGKYKWV